MRISHKNRARLIAAAAGISLFLNPGHATADDESGSGSGSPSESSSQSDSGGGSDSSGGDSSPGGSAPSPPAGGSQSSNNSEASSTGSPGGSESGGGDSGTSGDSGSSGDSGASGDSNGSGDGSPGASGPGGNEPTGDTPDTETTETDTSGTGTPTPDTNTVGTNTTDTPPAQNTTSPDTGPSDNGTTTSTYTEPATTTTETTETTEPSEPTYTPTSPDTTGSTGTWTDPTTNKTPISTTEPNNTSTNPPTADNTDTTTPDNTENSTDPTDSPTSNLRTLGFTALTLTDDDTQTDDTQTTDAPQTFSNATFFASTTATPQGTTTTTTPLTTLLSFLGIPQTGGPSTPTVTTSPAPWTLLWWIQRTQSLLNNQTPTATSTLAPVTDGYTISLITNDPDGDPLTTTITTQPTNGTATLNTDGTISYTRTPGTTAADQFTVQVSDNGPHIHGLNTLISLFTGADPHSTTVTVTIPQVTAPPVNNAPSITDIHYTYLDPSGLVTGYVDGLDIDNDPITYSFTWDAGKGAFNYDDATGDFYFMPTPEARHAAAADNATDADKKLTATVTVSDGSLTSTQALNITITPDNQALVPVAPTGTLGTVDRDLQAPTFGNTTGSLTGIATDANNDTLTYTVPTQPANGTVTITGDTFTYTPNSDSRVRTDTFTVTVNDGHGSTTDVPVTVNTVPMYFHAIDPTNQFWDPSDADFYNGYLEAGSPDGLVNYSVDGDGKVVIHNIGTEPIIVMAATVEQMSTMQSGGPANVDFTVIAPGTSHTMPSRPGLPDPGGTGDELIFVQAPRNPAGSGVGLGMIVLNQGTVYNSSIPVNHAPVVYSWQWWYSGQKSVGGAVIAGDPDPGDVLTYTYYWDATKGNFSYIPTAAGFAFTPNAAAQHAAAADDAPYTDRYLQLSVTISDGTLSTSSTYDIPIVPANQAVAATPPMDPLGTIDRDLGSGTYGTTTGSLAGIATDDDNDTLTYTVHTNGANGSVTIIGDTFTYTPNADSHADIDTFTVTVNDGHGSTTNVVIAVDTVPMWYHAIDPTNLFWDPSDEDYPAPSGMEFPDPTGLVDYLQTVDGIVIRNTGPDPIMVWSMTGDEYLAVLSGDPPTFDALVIASGTSATIPPRTTTPGSAWDGLVLLQSPRGPGYVNQLGSFQIGAGVIVDDSGIPQTPVTLAPSTDGQVTGQILNHQPGTTYSVQGATPTTNPGTYTTTDGSTIVIDDTTGTFTFTPNPTTQFWAGAGGPTTQTFTIIADDGTSTTPIVVFAPITPTSHVTVDATNLNTTDSPRYSYGITDNSGSPVLTVLDHNTAQTATIALPAGHDTTSTVTFSSDNNYAQITDTTGTNVSVIDLTTGQIVGAYTVTDNGDGTKTLTWTNGAPQAFSMRGMAAPDTDGPGFSLMGFTTNSFDTGDITGTDFRVVTDGTQAIIIARQADNTYDIYLGDTTTGTHTPVSTGTPLAYPASQYVPEAGFVPGTTIALVRDGSTITSISTTDATILNHSQSSYDFTAQWQITPDGEFAYTTERFGGIGGIGGLASVDVLNLTTGTLSRIEFPGGWSGSSGVVDAAHSTAYGYDFVDQFTVRITRYEFSDPTNTASITVDGTNTITIPYQMLGYYPFDADGNFYYATYTWTTVEGSPDPVAENSKIHVIDPGLNEIGTVYLDAGNKVALGAFVIDGTLYALMSNLTDTTDGGTYRVAPDGSITLVIPEYGILAADQQHLFVPAVGASYEPSSFSVFDLTIGTRSTPLVVPANSLNNFRVFGGKYLAISEKDGADTLIHILDVNGNITTVTIPNSSFAQFDYTDDLFTVTTTNGTTDQLTLIRMTTAAPNQAPVLNVGQEPTIDEINTMTGTVTVTGLTSYVTDPEGSTITFTSPDSNTVFDTNTPGTFYWTPTTEIRHAAAIPGAPQSHGVIIIADDGNGATRTFTVDVPVLAQNQAPFVTVSTPSNPADHTGTVTGTIIVTDGDGDTTIFTIDGGTATGANTFTTLGGGTLVIDPAAGTYTFTPSGTQRLAASHINATADDTSETIIIIVDDGHGGITSESITTAITAITAPGDLVNTALYGTDGTAYLHTSTYDPDTGLYSYHLATITPTGTVVATPVIGDPINDLLLGPTGIAYLNSESYDADADVFTYYLTMINASASTSSIEQLPGNPYSLVLGPDGTAYQSTWANDPDTGSTIYHLTIIRADGTATTAVVPVPPTSDLQIGPNGSAYQTLGNWDPHTGNTTYYLVTVTTDGVVTTAQIPGENAFLPSDLQIGPDGTAYQISYQWAVNPDPNASQYVYYLTTLTPAGTTTTVDLPDSPVETIQFGADGTAYLTFSLHDTATDTDTTHLLGVTPEGTVSTVAVAAGAAPYAAQVISDGTIYLVTHTVADDSTHITTVVPGGTPTALATLSGSPTGRPALGPDGTFYQGTLVPDPINFQNTYYLNAVTPSGTVTTTSAFPGYPSSSLSFRPDGTVHQLTWDLDPDPAYYGASFSYSNSFTPDGVVTSTLLPATADEGVIFGPDGTTYIATREYVPDPADPGIYRITDYITVISSAGTVTDIQLVGIAAEGALLQAGPDGSVYKTTDTGDPDNPITYVTTVNATGIATTTTIVGLAAGTVRFGPDGTVYQTTSDPNSGTTYVTTISTDGTTTTVAITNGSPAGTVQFAPDGTVSQIVTGNGATRLVVL